MRTFIWVTFGASWSIAVFLRWGGLGNGIAGQGAFLGSAFAMALATAWQPLLAVWCVKRSSSGVRSDDVGLLNARKDLWLVAGCSSFGLLVVAAVLRLAWGPAGEAGAPWMPTVEAPGHDVASGWGGAVLRIATALVAPCLFWVTSLGQEVGWRGFLLPRLQAGLGWSGGLLVQGVLWGLWYLPLALLVHSRRAGSGADAVVLLTDLSLLGIALGWIRWRSRGVLPATVAHFVLISLGGLPLLLQGRDVGVRGDVYGFEGMLPLAGVVAVLLLWGHKHGRSRAVVPGHFRNGGA